MFNHYLGKLLQTGVIDRQRERYMGGSNRNMDASKNQGPHDGLGYDSVFPPFLALFAGLCAAVMLFGMETVTICKKKWFSNDELQNGDGCKSEGAKDIIDDIHCMLMKNHSKHEDLRFLSKVRDLLHSHDNHHG